MNIQDSEMSWTALHYATLNTNLSSRIDTIHALITLGANVYTLDNEGHRASKYVEDKEETVHFTYPEEQKAKAAKLTVSPYNIKIPELAKLLQVSYTTLFDWIKKYKKEHNRQIHQQQKNKAIEMFKSGMKAKEIAKTLEKSIQSVSYWLQPYKNNHGISMPPRYPQDIKDQAVKMLIEDGIDKVEIIKKLNLQISIETLDT